MKGNGLGTRVGNGVNTGLGTGRGTGMDHGKGMGKSMKYSCSTVGSVPLYMAYLALVCSYL